jgi:putative Ca2+/H+ antiporter (TMEM165/GDT1 family)
MAGRSARLKSLGAQDLNTWPKSLLAVRPQQCGGLLNNRREEVVLTDPIILSLFFVFAAEMGDKTQLVALAFATRYAAQTVLLGVFGATLLVHLFSVGLGELVGLAIPAFWVHVLAGVSFIAFGVWTVWGDDLSDDDRLSEHRWGPLMTVGTTFFLAELGDKTMLMTITLASQYHNFVGVWIGSTLGMVAADGLAITVGTVLGARLPERMIKYGAAAVFVITGVAALIETASNQPVP